MLGSNKASNEPRPVVRIVGGLGNQLFQFAFAYQLAKRWRRGVDLDIGVYDRYRGHEGFLLGPLLPEAARLANQYFYPSKLPSLLDFWLRVEARFPKIPAWLTRISTIREGAPFTYQHTPESLSGKTLFIGFWQSWKYFENESKEMKHLLRDWLKIEQRRSELRDRLGVSAERTVVMVHVRRGDYTNLQGLYGLLGDSYYKSAVELITKKIESPLYLVFSDDLDAARSENLFQSDDVVFFDDTNLSSPEVLSYMVSCDHFITANSTFSWWAAYLGSAHANSIVVCPDIWLRGLGSNPDLIPPSWHAISAWQGVR